MTVELVLLCVAAFLAGFTDAVAGGGAQSKFVNLATNLGSMVFFMWSRKIIYAIALPMAICNALGGMPGARLAILKGNAFIRIFFLVVVCLVILRFAWDVLK